MGVTAKDYGVSYKGAKNVLNLTVVMFTQFHEYTKKY